MASADFIAFAVVTMADNGILEWVRFHALVYKPHLFLCSGWGYTCVCLCPCHLKFVNFLQYSGSDRISFKPAHSLHETGEKGTPLRYFFSNILHIQTKYPLDQPVYCTKACLRKYHVASACELI